VGSHITRGKGGEAAVLKPGRKRFVRKKYCEKDTFLVLQRLKNTQKRIRQLLRAVLRELCCYFLFISGFFSNV
jgi:hypothetical protein